MLNKASSLNRLLFESGSPSRTESSLELEALAAVHQLSIDVQSISVSEMLPVRLNLDHIHHINIIENIRSDFFERNNAGRLE
jgi:hypothetical protein